MSSSKDYFNVRDYFDQRNTQSDTILKFRYIKILLLLLIMHSSAKMIITFFPYHITKALSDNDSNIFACLGSSINLSAFVFLVLSKSTK